MFEKLKHLYSRADQQRALDLLHDPASYPSLPSMEPRDMVLQLCLAPSFEPFVSWTIFQSSKDSCVVRRVRWDFATDFRCGLGDTTYGADAVCPPALISQAFADLSCLTVPVFSFRDSFGLDGVTYGFRRQSRSQFFELSWWHQLPEGCEAVSEWYHHLTAQCEALLPAHTDSLRISATRP